MLLFNRATYLYDRDDASPLYFKLLLINLQAQPHMACGLIHSTPAEEKFWDKIPIRLADPTRNMGGFGMGLTQLTWVWVINIKPIWV